MTISDYINEQDEAIRPRLLQVYNAIRTAIPDAEECISWQMPTFRKGRNIIHFAAYKKHIGLYPGPQTVEEFADKLIGYKTSKGAIQFPHDQDIPLDLIAQIAKRSYKINTKQ
jgi:uncharacterized protein YdhG (YjbR/CyaY superfamily)